MSSPPVAVTAAGRLPPSSRYRHPGDVIRLISAGLVLACSLAVSWVARRWLLGTAAAVPGGLGTAGRVITGLVQVACLAAAAVVVAATLRRRRFRLLAGLAAGAVAAAVLAEGIFLLLGGQRPAALTANLARGSWLAGAAFPAPALFASAAAVVVAAAPWLSRPWRRAAWLDAAAGRGGAAADRHGAADAADPGPRHRGHGGRRGAGGVRRARPADRSRRDRGRAAATRACR